MNMYCFVYIQYVLLSLLLGLKWMDGKLNSGDYFYTKAPFQIKQNTFVTATHLDSLLATLS